MRKRYVKLLGVVLVILASGCAVGRPLSMSEEAELRQLHIAHPRGLGYSVAVAPVGVFKSHIAEGKKKWPMSFKPAEMQKEIATVLREIPVFAEVTQVHHSNPTAAGEAGARLLLKVSFSDCTTSFGGTNGYFIPNMLIWGILSPIASAFVADEFFVVEGKVVAQLLDTRSGESVWSRSIPLRERYDLNDWQRGPTIWDFFFIAPFYHTWTPAKVDAVVLPHVVRKVQVELAKGILSDVQPPRSSIAVVIGLNSCGLPDSPELNYAQSDSQTVARLLSDSGFDDVTVLKGAEATVSAVEDTLRKSASRSDVDIERVVVFFSGLGTTVAGGPSVLLYGTEVEESELSLLRIFEMLREIPARDRIVIVDAGFSGIGGKTFRIAGDSSGTEAPQPGQLSGSNEVAFLLSCGLSETAYESDELGHGVFTHYLLQRGLTRKADLNNDGMITVHESLTSSSWLVTRYAHGKLQGKSQKPCIFGSDTGKTEFLKLK
jgi:hypothetical protein